MIWMGLISPNSLISLISLISQKHDSPSYGKFGWVVDGEFPSVKTKLKRNTYTPQILDIWVSFLKIYLII